MDKPEQSQATPRDYLAAERTFLAWIRTGLALMGLGFVLARFGIFLRQFNFMRPGLATASFAPSLWFGTALLLLGVAVCLWSLSRYLRLVRSMRAGSASFSHPSTLAVAVAAVLAVLGLAMGYYLMSTRHAAAGAGLNRQQEVSMSTMADNGVVRVASQHTVGDTVARLESILVEKNVKLFTIVDHSGEAEKAGLKMPNTKLLVFGNPKAGTPLMLASPSIALDLPLKILVAEDTTGQVWISYNSPVYLQQRHNLPADLLPNIAVIEALASKAGQ
jgi:uncharacterized protein (DUF302 family)/uncharacterized membrane protein YidH (DUF202 family)